MLVGCGFYGKPRCLPQQSVSLTFSRAQINGYLLIIACYLRPLMAVRYGVQQLHVCFQQLILSNEKTWKVYRLLCINIIIIDDITMTMVTVTFPVLRILRRS